MMTFTGRLLAVLVFVGLLGGCAMKPIEKSENAKDPNISTNTSNNRAATFPDMGK